VAKAQEMANVLGGRLEEPRLSWKYSWIRTLFGWNAAKQATIILPGARSAMLRFWDRSMLRMQNRTFAPSGGSSAL
jgi:hypothetical protein